MKNILHLILPLIILANAQNIEIFNEKAWMDEKGRDKFFEYSDSDIIEPATVLLRSRESKYSNNIDFEQFEESQKLKPQSSATVHMKNHGTNSPLGVIDLFLNSIKKFIHTQPQQSLKEQTRHFKNETSKGIDIKFDNNIHSLPKFGNHQDMKFILLGTKWCGSGSIAKDKNDIGYFYLTDNCCREHDLCEQVLEPGDEKFGLKNSGKFSRLHCDCDDTFYKCLKGVNTLISKQIGIFYFNILSHQCFKEEFPISCDTKVKGRCVKYTKNREGMKSYQWFDNKWF
ncbi:hypothetical protein PVAND_012499 [Polypedilum vanderplanki]|uniref:Phospholipase A2 n=1 Tax=Polypedilum vanderplanki TaxID=319348 RepID=A0A9J6CNK5_POLVA|nr:hypothetical protein PVAND_012499 [Polypedilum vanderplanki]